LLGQGGDDGIHLLADIGGGFCSPRNEGHFSRQICGAGKWNIGQHHRLTEP